jgi:exopolyphosphatase/guanosine-5'-triphosphate,3'-diphosphate pyrophosphatase
MTATSAARDAHNRDDFFTAATAAVGVAPELLGGDEEARLSFLGATSELEPDDGPFLVADIGGGSTEFAVGAKEPDGVLSTDIGCVRLTEKFLHSDPPAPEELSQAFDIVRGHLDDVARVIPSVADVRRFVGLAGTVTTMAAVELGLATYDRDRIHHFVLTRAAAEDVFRTLATESRRQRIHNPGLEEARADVIVGGAVIVTAIMRYFDFDECLVSEADILDGLVLSLRG